MGRMRTPTHTFSRRSSIATTFLKLHNGRGPADSAQLVHCFLTTAHIRTMRSELVGSSLVLQDLQSVYLAVQKIATTEATAGAPKRWPHNKPNAGLQLGQLVECKARHKLSVPAT